MLTACAWGRRRVLLALTAIAFVVASTTVFKSVISAPWLASLAATRRLRIAPSYLNDCVGPRNAKGSLRKRGQCGRFGPHLTSFLAFKPPLFAVLLIDDAAEQVKRASEASVAAGSLVLANANAAKMLRSPEGADTTDALQLAAEKAELVKRTREVDEEMQRVRNVQLELQEAADFCVANGLFAQVTEADVVAALSDPSAAPAFRESYGDVVYHVLSAGIARRAESSSTAHTPPEAPAVDHAAP